MLTNTSVDHIAQACEQLREADHLITSALTTLIHSDVEVSTGMSAEMVLQLDARLTHADARALVNAAAVLRRMTRTREAVLRGMISFSQVRVIAALTKTLDATQREVFDRRIGEWAPAYADRDPEDLLSVADDLAASLRPDLLVAKEDRMVEREFLAIQGRFDGGSSVYGEFGPESTATIVERLDAEADAPVNADDEDAPSRAQQRAAALVEVCAQDGGSHRARPRFLVHAELDDLQNRAGAKLLWPLPGRAPRLSHIATETLGCDATVIPVMTDDGRPIWVGDATANVTRKQRAALIARDQGCRFPGCTAPTQWADAHHLKARIHEGPTTIDNLILLCRRCHRRVHRFRWRIAPKENGVIEFKYRGRTLPSFPKLRAPSRE